MLALLRIRLFEGGRGATRRPLERGTEEETKKRQQRADAAAERFLVAQEENAKRRGRETIAKFEAEKAERMKKREQDAEKYSEKNGGKIFNIREAG